MGHAGAAGDLQPVVQPRRRHDLRAGHQVPVLVLNPSQSADREAWLALLAIAGQGLIYLTSLRLAHWLGVDGFDDYAVASAVFMLLAGIACLGSEKYALRVLPVWLERGDWARIGGYIRFGLKRGLTGAVLLCGGVALVAFALGDALQPATRRTIIVAALALPLAAAVHFGLELLTALGREFSASAIFRLIVPAVALGGVLLLGAVQAAPSGLLAVLCWGPAWLVALTLQVAVARRALPPAVRQAVPRVEAKAWRAESRPFLYYRLALGLLSQS
ncbi:MAG TPA: hypothetical protein PLO41_02980, partial [Rubrivivax sp.]|nr:hypothetical protein [Rubrivivax sp.]